MFFGKPVLRSPVLIRVVRNIAYWRMVLAACDTRRCTLTFVSPCAPADGSAFSHRKEPPPSSMSSLSRRLYSQPCALPLTCSGAAQDLSCCLLAKAHKRPDGRSRTGFMQRVCLGRLTARPVGRCTPPDSVGRCATQCMLCGLGSKVYVCIV